MDTKTAIKKMMNGEMSDNQIITILTDLNNKGITAQDIAAAAEILREKVTPIKAPANAVDCCGTGGDGAHTYNISTAVAIIAASCGVPVAKHGNRAASSKSGAADVLEALGINLNAPHEKLELALQKFNFAFLMAPNHHNAMKHVAAARKEMKTRTIFNLLGPLANPANTKRQLIGVYDRNMLTPIAEALRSLGSEKAWIVHGEDGLDEITITGKTHIAILDHGHIEYKILTPADFGLPEAKLSDIKGGDAKENAAALKNLLNGTPSAYRNIVLMNTAAILNIADKTTTLEDGVHKAATAIDSGKAAQLLETYREFTS